MKRVVFLFLFLACCNALSFGQQGKVTTEAELDVRVRELSQQLRCLVCQNETLADSQADLAADLKKQIREQMRDGKSDKEILAFLTQRYGDFVLYRPPVTWRTYVLWFGPFALLAGGMVALFRYIKSRRDQIHEQPLSSDEHKRAAELLDAGVRKEPA